MISYLKCNLWLRGFYLRADVWLLDRVRHVFYFIPTPLITISHPSIDFSLKRFKQKEDSNKTEMKKKKFNRPKTKNYFVTTCRFFNDTLPSGRNFYWIQKVICNFYFFIVTLLNLFCILLYTSLLSCSETLIALWCPWSVVCATIGLLVSIVIFIKRQMVLRQNHALSLSIVYVSFCDCYFYGQSQ